MSPKLRNDPPLADPLRMSPTSTSQDGGKISHLFCMTPKAKFFQVLPCFITLLFYRLEDFSLALELSLKDYEVSELSMMGATANYKVISLPSCSNLYRSSETNSFFSWPPLIEEKCVNKVIVLEMEIQSRDKEISRLQGLVKKLGDQVDSQENITDYVVGKFKKFEESYNESMGLIDNLRNSVAKES